jgi:hypothetical protein
MPKQDCTQNQIAFPEFVMGCSKDGPVISTKPALPLKFKIRSEATKVSADLQPWENHNVLGHLRIPVC